MADDEPQIEQAQTDEVVRQQREAPQALKRLLSRRRVDAGLDALRLRLDTFPHGAYQPVPELGFQKAKRVDGSLTRWERMRPVVEREGVASAVDVGPSNGYFVLELARIGIPALGIEGDAMEARISTTAVRRSGIEHAGIAHFMVTEKTLPLVPPVDALILLSVWHHLVWHTGLEAATALLRGLWERTGKVMFFDTGEREMPPHFNLPAMEPDGRTWLTGYLEETCAGARVEHLGAHAAFDAEGRPAERNLFAVLRA